MRSPPDELAGALIVLAETKDAGKREAWAKRGAAGALLWMADKLQSDQGEHARVLWTAKGKRAFAAERASTNLTATQDQPDGGG